MRDISCSFSCDNLLRHLEGVLVSASASSGDIFSFVPATFTLSFNRPLSASFVIQLGAHHADQKCPRQSRHLQMGTSGRILHGGMTITRSQ
jgi:hypothetical protein